MAQVPSLINRLSNAVSQFWGKETPVSNQTTESSEKVQYILNKFDKYLSYFEDDRDRENESWKFYHGLEHGQWEESAVSKLESENRRVPQFNFIRKKIDTLVSSLIKNYLDVDFVPVDGVYTPLTTVLKTLYYSDKEMMDWDVSYIEFLRDFLIFSGTEEIVINRRYSPLGNIGFERVTPGHILFDPEWTTTSGWDLKEALKMTFYSPDRLKEEYDIDSKELDVQLELIKKNGKSFDSTDFDNADLPKINLDDVYGSQYRVIEDHRIEQERVEIEYSFDSQGNIVEVPEGSDQSKREWAILNNIDVQSGVFKKKVPVNKYYITTICPQIFNYKPIQDKLAFMQFGRLPFMHKSSMRVNGKNTGQVEILKDVQETINKRESLIDQMIANSASGGAIIDPELFGNDYGKLEEAKANFNNPTYREFSKPGEIASGRKHVEEFPRSQFPNDVVNELQRMYTLSDTLSYTPAAGEGRSEGSEDRAGSIYTRKLQQAELNLTFMNKMLEQHNNEKGEAYMYVAQQLYAGIYREFKVAGSKNESIGINEEIETPIGTIVKNDISQLPRHKIIVSQSPQGITYREVQRSVNAEVLQAIPPQNPISRAVAVKNIMTALDVSMEEREQYKEAADLEMKLAIESTKAQIAGFMGQQAQLQMQLQQMMNPQVMAPQGTEQPQAQPQEGAQGVPPVLPQK